MPLQRFLLHQGIRGQVHKFAGGVREIHVEKKLEQLGYTLAPASPKANYGRLIYFPFLLTSFSEV